MHRPVVLTRRREASRSQLGRVAAALRALESEEEQQAFIANYSFKRKGGNRNRVFTEDEELFLRVVCDVSSKGGFPLDKLLIRDLMRKVVSDREHPLHNSRTGKPFIINSRFVKNWMTRRSIRQYKTSAISPERAAKATGEVCLNWFELCDSYIKELHDAQWRRPEAAAPHGPVGTSACGCNVCCAV